MEVEEAKIKYLQLKDIKGHWNGAESNPDVDHYNGEKHQAMNVSIFIYFYIKSFNLFFRLYSKNTANLVPLLKTF
jgi:hypothetical protein